MLWDHLFGTYEREVEPCVYGTKKPFESVDPLWTIASEYVSLYKTIAQTKGIRAKLKCIYKPPGWSAPDEELRQGTLSIHQSTVVTPQRATSSDFVSSLKVSVPSVYSDAYEWNATRVTVSIVQFLSVVVFTVLFLASEDTVSKTLGLQIIAAILGLCWGLGALMARSINYLQLFFINLVCYIVLALQLSAL